MGTFLRAFTVGHVRQLDAVQEDLHDRAREAGAGITEPVLKLSPITQNRPPVIR